MVASEQPMAGGSVSGRSSKSIGSIALCWFSICSSRFHILHDLFGRAFCGLVVLNQGITERIYAFSNTASPTFLTP